MQRPVSICTPGRKIGVASTKAFTSQVVALALLTLKIGRLRDLSVIRGREIIDALQALPGQIQQILDRAPEIETLAEEFKRAQNFLYLGRGYNFPTALEGALKLKEISYIDAEGYPAAEMKHGPIALIDELMPVVFIAPHDSVFDKVASNVQEVKARKGRVIAITSREEPSLAGRSTTSSGFPRRSTCSRRCWRRFRSSSSRTTSRSSAVRTWTSRATWPSRSRSSKQHLPQAPRIVLASQSPRRRDLLALIGITHTVRPADIDERVLPGETPLACAERLARGKAAAIAVLEPDALVIAADTIVVIDDRILKKPADAAEALSMLRRLRGRVHRCTPPSVAGGATRWSQASRPCGCGFGR